SPVERGLKPRSKLFKKPHVVLKEQLQIVNVVLQHGVTIDAAAKRKAAVFFRVVIDESVKVRVNHAGAHHFDPSRAFANAAAGSIAEHTRDVDFCSGFDKRKEARPQARFGLLAEESFMKAFQRSLQIGERDALIDDQTFDLMEHRRVSRIERIASEYASRTDDANRRLHLF